MRVLSVLVLAMLLFGCGASNFQGAFYSNPTTILSGSGGQQAQVVFNLTQTGNTISGSMATNPPGGPTGQLTGQVNGDQIQQFTLSLSQGAGSCSQFTGTGSYSNYVLTLNYNANCGGGSPNSGSLTAVRQQR